MNILCIGDTYLIKELKQTNNVISVGKNDNYDIKVESYFCNLEKDILNRLPPDFHPELILMLEGPEILFPEGLEKTPLPLAWHAMDTHVNMEWHKEYAALFDYLFVCQKDCIPELKNYTNAKIVFLPLSCDPDINTYLNIEKKYDVVFVGTVHKEYYNRYEYLEFFKSHINIKIFQNIFQEEMNKIFNQAKIILNHPIKNDLNFRVFEAMASGSLLITPNNTKSLKELFQNNNQIITFDPTDLLSGVNKIKYYLENEEEREKIARNGYAEVIQKHTRLSRAKKIVDFIEKNQLLEKSRKPDIYKNLGNTYYIVSQLSFGFNKKEKQYKENGNSSCIQMYSTHIKISPNDLEGYCFLAMSIEKEILKDAIIYFNSLLPINKNSLLTDIGLSVLSFNYNNRDKGIKFLAQALKKDNTKAKAYIKNRFLPGKNSLNEYINLGQIFWDLQEIEESIAYFHKALDIDVNNEELCICLSFAYSKLNNKKQADYYLEKSRQLNNTFNNCK